jgi:hypothetical protein
LRASCPRRPRPMAGSRCDGSSAPADRPPGPVRRGFLGEYPPGDCNGGFRASWHAIPRGSVHGRAQRRPRKPPYQSCHDCSPRNRGQRPVRRRTHATRGGVT